MSSKIEQILKETGTLKEGHFLLTSGLHSSRYLEKFNILQYPRHTRFLCKQIAAAFKGKDIGLVAGPALGGIIIAYEVASLLKVKCIFAEREDNQRTFRRGMRIEEGARVLVVDDIVTTGGSLDDMIALIGRYGGRVAGIGVFFDRRSDMASGQETKYAEIPFYSCFRLPLPAYQPESCPLCSQKVPLVKPGSSL